jgi:hypothetical protein
MRSPLAAIMGIASLALLLSAAVSARAESGPDSGSEATTRARPDHDEPDSDPLDASPVDPYVIQSVDFEVQGITLPFVLRQKLDLTFVGSHFPDINALEKYIDSQKQLLLNQRVLASVASRYVSTEAQGGGYDVRVTFSITDTWNIVGLPYFKYDSNTGLTLSMRGRDYNFLGSMQPLVLNLDYRRDTGSLNSFGNSTNFTFPFQALGLDWSLGVSEDLQVWFGGSTPRSITSASLGIRVPAGGASTMSIAFAQGLSINANAPEPESDPWYLSTSLSFSASIPTGIDLGFLGPIAYTPGISISENWIPGQTIQYPDRGGTTITITHGISFGRVDWLGNFRHGMSVSVASSNSNTLQNTSAGGDLNLKIAWYGTWQDFFGIAIQLQTINRYLGNALTNLGSNLRGILDARVSGTRGDFLNLSLPVKLFNFPTHMLIGTDWLDFELQAQPFFDAADVEMGPGFPRIDDLWFSGGFELLFFPKRLRSFIVRASLGFDLKAVIANRSFTARTADGHNPYEIYFGTGLMY